MSCEGSDQMSWEGLKGLELYFERKSRRKYVGCGQPVRQTLGFSSEYISLKRTVEALRNGGFGSCLVHVRSVVGFSPIVLNISVIFVRSLLTWFYGFWHRPRCKTYCDGCSRIAWDVCLRVVLTCFAKFFKPVFVKRMKNAAAGLLLVHVLHAVLCCFATFCNPALVITCCKCCKQYPQRLMVCEKRNKSTVSPCQWWLFCFNIMFNDFPIFTKTQGETTLNAKYPTLNWSKLKLTTSVFFSRAYHQTSHPPTISSGARASRSPATSWSTWCFPRRGVLVDCNTWAFWNLAVSTAGGLNISYLFDIILYIFYYCYSF